MINRFLFRVLLVLVVLGFIDIELFLYYIIDFIVL